MASKAAAATATKVVKAKVNEKEVPDKAAEKDATPDAPESPLPLLDLSDAAISLSNAFYKKGQLAGALEHLALAAASKRLKDLETRLGVQLFERRARGVETTEAGRALVRHIRSLNASLHALESEVVEFSRGIKGHLRIASNTSAIAECLPPYLVEFSQAHAQIRISLEDLTSAEVQAAVAEGRADVGVFTAPLLDSRMQTFNYRSGRLAVLVPEGHALAERASISFDELLDYDLVGLHAGAAAHDAHLAHMAHAYAMYSSVAVGTLGILLAFVVYTFGWINPDKVADAVKPRAAPELVMLSVCAAGEAPPEVAEKLRDEGFASRPAPAGAILRIRPVAPTMDT